MPDDRTTPPNPDAADAPSPAVAGAGAATKRVGVLFVHGIGMQRRGDTLLQAGAALHRWLQAWLAQPALAHHATVELVDTQLSHGRGDEPAHTQLLFRAPAGDGDRTLLLAESCWANAFRPSSYRAFVGWALRGFWLTVVLHMLSVFRRHERIGRLAGQAMRQRFLSDVAARRLELELGLDPGVMPTDPRLLRRFLERHSTRSWTRWLVSPFLLSGLLLVVVGVQVLLLAVVLIALLPLGFLKSFAARVQTTVAAVLGDSYLFVASPLSESAAVTQVQADLRWLAQRCDAVVLVAHSQGAAVAHRALEAMSCEGRLPAPLELLLTYGSGLQKLFALKALQTRQASPLSALARRLAVGATVPGTAFVLGSWVLVGYDAPWWLAGLSMGAGFVLLMLAYGFFERAFARVNPAPLPEVPWLNLFASADPVCNGPVELQAPQGLARGGGMPMPAQREVVNLDSLVADHTRYWQAADDFVGRVAGAVLHVGGYPYVRAEDEPWLAHSRLRRRWRVGVLAACRRTLVLAAMLLAWWPRDALEPIGRLVGHAAGRAVTSGSAGWLTDGLRSVQGEPRWAGAVSLMLAVALAYGLALAGWKLWEAREIDQFFRRAPYRAPGLGVGLLAAGWFAGLVAVPLAAGWLAGGDARWLALGTVLALLAVTGLTTGPLRVPPSLAGPRAPVAPSAAA